ncbi:hypothetical protein AKJ49_00770 [candidate division MSBL1 archaeon SCGC-AAA382A03]|uniref:Type-4 uracil-DNA glycosylase n=1 Tax=candidate division MSBL1 archaeon SCGC-AAA382A03 TaxID=1698278 RepID=A0A133VG84_9EURY|nr:hypothetical protein AKJ49_00770 [candidate division MSBL1 archaeon SCGC-AAA382A03]
MTDLEKIANEINNCTLCDLHKNRTNAVPGEGPEDAKIMLIGEAPGYHEDQQGRPFVGDAGDLLTKLLEEFANLKRDEVFIGNVLKCRPPDNRDPNDEEIEKCSPYLKKQILSIEPKLIVTLGRFATKLLLDRSVKISKEHGELEDGEYGGWNCKLFISYHPAAALYGADVGKKLENDFEKLGEIAKDLNSFKTTKQTTF